MKKGEDIFCDVKSEYLLENDKSFCEKHGVDPKENMVADIILYNFVSVDELYHKHEGKVPRNGKTISLGKGKYGKHAKADSTVDCKIFIFIMDK